MKGAQAYINAKEEDIIIVQSPVGMPGRAIHNAFMERAKQGRIPHGRCHTCISTCKPDQTPYCITEALVNAAEGRVDDALLFCGSNAYRAEKLEHVSDILDEFRDGHAKILGVVLNGVKSFAGAADNTIGRYYGKYGEYGYYGHYNHRRK